jgi:uncharacterized membrane protein YkvA (DUF1232 family)
MKKFAMMYVVPIVSLIYIISPIDFIPDVIPVVGWLDDGGAFLAGLSTWLVALRQSRKKFRAGQSEKGNPEIGDKDSLE